MSESNEPRRVAVIGGGPGGASCALTLLQGARASGRDLEVLVFEPKEFGQHFNQCAGVLRADHLDRAMADLGLRVPDDLVQRTVRSYVLHAETDDLALCAEDDDTASCATRRVQLDEFLLGVVRGAGGVVHQDRMTDLELGDKDAVIYTEGRTYRVDAVVGAFGLDPGATSIFARRSPYRPPPCIDTLVAKVHPAGLDHIDGLLGDQIHAFLPRLPRIEFGALIPKGNHVEIVVAGHGVRERDMHRFLALPRVAGLLPENPSPSDCFRGTFPVGVARAYVGPRYIMVGDAAGLVRPFKGGGIHAALLTGRRAGLALLEHESPRDAGTAYAAACADLRGDLWYGRALRRLVALLSGRFRLEAVLDLARESPALRRVLYDCVSGRESYRHIVSNELSLPLALRTAWACLAWPLRSRSTGIDDEQ